MLTVIRHLLTSIGTLMSHPAALLVLAVSAALRTYFQPSPLDWHGFATFATWLMTLFIQRAEHRDTQAIHAKLDELVRATAQADDDVATLDKEEPEDIEE